jgi:iron complex outermembrane receptor protein
MSAPDMTFDNSCFSAGSTSEHFPLDCRVDSFTDLDLTGRYSIDDHLVASFAVLNLFDAEPPLDPINYAGTNYNPTWHQAGIVGRFWKLGLAYRF